MSAPGDDSEALREALTDEVAKLLGSREFAGVFIDTLLPLVLAYGREQASQALRDAAQAIIDGRRDPETGYRRFDSIEYQLCEADADGWLETRADELGGQA